MVLRLFQVDGRNFLRIKKRAILADEMGMGKSAQAISACEEEKFTKVLVITKKSIKGSWKIQVDTWTDHKQCTIIGSKMKPVEKAALLRNPNPGYTVCHFEQMKAHKADIIAGDYDAIIVDEAHNAKNRQAQTTKALFSICIACKRAHVYFLTGTPIMNRADELWSLLHMIDPKKFSSYWNWVKVNMKTRLVTFPGRQWPVTKIDGPIDAPKMKRDLEPYLLRREKSDFLQELPEKTFITIPVEMEGKQKQDYSSMSTLMYSKIKEGLEVATTVAAVKIVYLKQICVSHYLLDKDSKSLEGCKIDALFDLIENIADDEKIVIFSQFAQCIKRLNPLLAKVGRVVSFTGEDNDDAYRSECIRQFQEDPEVKFFTTTIRAGGEGTTATAASIVIFMDKDWNPARNNQAIDRVHRMGQTKPVTIYSFQVQRTIESWIERMLKKKEELFGAVVPVFDVDVIEAIRAGEVLE